MKIREALDRMIDLRVPGAVEAAALLPSDRNVTVDTASIAAPLLIAASHVGASPIMDDAARLTDLNLPLASQKKFAVGALFELGARAWDHRGELRGDRIAVHAKRLFEATLVGFVFFKHRGLLRTSAVLLVATLVCAVGPTLLQALATAWLERAAHFMGADLGITLQYLAARRKHDRSYGALKKTLDRVSKHAETPGLPSLAPYTQDRLEELASKPAEHFELYSITDFRALADHVDEKVLDWSQTQHGSDLATRQLARILQIKMATFDPALVCIQRAVPPLLCCLGVALVVAVAKQTGIYLFQDDASARRRAGRVTNAMLIVGAGAAVAGAARWNSTSWLPWAATTAVLVAAKQFTVWSGRP